MYLYVQNNVMMHHKTVNNRFQNSIFQFDLISKQLKFTLNSIKALTLYFLFYWYN